MLQPVPTPKPLPVLTGPEITLTFTRMESYALATFVAQPDWKDAALLVAQLLRAKGV